ncbi:MAG TPA: hypothetical protein VGL66_17410 [Caulobacteraceae bacterium]
MTLFKNCFLCRWLGFPEVAPIEKAIVDWDDAQANDYDITHADPLYEQVLAAIELKKTDPERAFESLLRLAKQNSIWAMAHAAWCYFSGEGVATDVVQSEIWYRAATDGGSQHALLSYLRFPAARKDWACYDTALKHPRFIDWAPALRRRANRALSRPPSGASRAQARQWYERASELGDRKAAFDLARKMTQGKFGLSEIPAGWKRLGSAIEALECITEAETTIDEERVEAVATH